MEKYGKKQNNRDLSALHGMEMNQQSDFKIVHAEEVPNTLNVNYRRPEDKKLTSGYCCKGSLVLIFFILLIAGFFITLNRKGII